VLFATLACSNKGEHPVTAGNGGGSALTGAGSTFINPVMSRWIADFQKERQVQINYQSIGSGGGIQQLKNGLVDFGASDAALDDRQSQENAGGNPDTRERRASLHYLQPGAIEGTVALARCNLGGNLSRDDQELAGSGNQEGQSRY
jgi:hypothetical protein